jgi:hypothetical protein
MANKNSINFTKIFAFTRRVGESEPSHTVFRQTTKMNAFIESPGSSMIEL